MNAVDSLFPLPWLAQVSRWLSTPVLCSPVRRGAHRASGVHAVGQPSQNLDTLRRDKRRCSIGSANRAHDGGASTRWQRAPARPTQPRHQPGALRVWRVHHGPDVIRPTGDQHLTFCPKGPDTPTHRGWHIHHHPHRHSVLCGRGTTPSVAIQHVPWWCGRYQASSPAHR